MPNTQHARRLLQSGALLRGLGRGFLRSRRGGPRPGGQCSRPSPVAEKWGPSPPGQSWRRCLICWGSWTGAPAPSGSHPRAAGARGSVRPGPHGRIRIFRLSRSTPALFRSEWPASPRIPWPRVPGRTAYQKWQCARTVGVKLPGNTPVADNQYSADSPLGRLRSFRPGPFWARANPPGPKWAGAGATRSERIGWLGTPQPAIPQNDRLPTPAPMRARGRLCRRKQRRPMGPDCALPCARRSGQNWGRANGRDTTRQRKSERLCAAEGGAGKHAHPSKQSRASASRRTHNTHTQQQ